MSGTYEWSMLDNSFRLERSWASPPIDISLVKATMKYYSSLSTRGASCEWIDGPLGLVNSWIKLQVPNGCLPDRLVPSKDIFIPFIVYGYDAGDGCHLIESYNFNSERTKVDFTRLSAPSIRHQGGRKFLSEIQPQSHITKDVKQADAISVKQADEISVKQADEISVNQPQSDITKDVKQADEVAVKQADGISVKLPDEILDEAKLESARKRYFASVYKQKNEMEEVLRNVSLENQQLDWEKVQKEKKEQRRLKAAKRKLKKEQNRKKK